jgi:hypothetical protein
MKLLTEVEDTRMLDMLCNGLYGDDVFDINVESYELASKWCKENPKAIEDLSMPQCYEPRIYAYLRSDKANSIKIYDNYSDENLELTWDGMVKGMQLLASDHQRHFRDLMEGNDDFYTANSWLQLALLGDVVYG